MEKNDIATKSHSWCPQPFGLTSPKPHDRMPALNKIPRLGTRVDTSRSR